MDTSCFVFLDETSATTNITRRYGWCPRGERLVSATPWGHWKTTTFVAGLRSDGIIAPLVLDRAMTGEMFRAYVGHQGRLQDELLDGEIFYSLQEAKVVIESWRRHYNSVRPHVSLGYKPPAPEVFVPALAAGSAAPPRPAPPARLSLAPRPTMH
jgi:transposase InsO family protein